MKAFCAEDATSATASVSQARVLARSCSKLYQTLKRYQPSMKWERLPFKLWRWQNVNDNKGEKLQSMEIALRGMEMVLASKSPIPTSLLAGEVKDSLKNVQERVIVSIRRVNNSPQPSVTPESDPEKSDECLQTLQEIPGTPQDLPFYFFLFCLRLVETLSVAKPEENKVKVNVKDLENSKTRSWLSDWDSKKVMPALKISLSLGLAIFLGSIYSKPNGYWEITLLKSLALEKVLAKNDISWDIELGKTPNPSLSCVEKEPEKILETYLQHCRSVADGIFCVEEGGEEVKVDKSEVVLSLSALGFCVESIGKETREIEEMVKEVVKSENPSSHVNLHEISCKIRSLYK